ncbi:hypothetical protein L5515_002181 [Caenorhabditis briggsae]|uniref:C2H2-type domain-containing protein n=1 Tax=Caenorhabditis briggsae TaxID=6238 RepID=A0AAE9E816_CAEBR|nr:hypothetical protein L5515_002181 [Caenorhabditis briggsae]
MTPKSKNEETRKPESLHPTHHSSPPSSQPLPQDPPGPPQPSSPPSRENCECCRRLLEHATPYVAYVNVSKSDVVYDRTLCLYKLESPPPPPPTSSTSHTPDSQPSSSSNPPNNNNNPYPPPVLPKVKRILDRFEEAKLWDLMGLNQQMYKKLPAELTKISPKRMVFRKCAYRLHNTRHFDVPLNKKCRMTKEEILKQNYEDDKKLIKKNQAFNCVWNDCPHAFHDPQDMRIHYMFDHDSIKLFCCGTRYENYDAYLEHYVTTMNGEGHATWMARECWGCNIRLVDAASFYTHAEECEAQINPFPCPDPLCGIRFEYLTDVVDHFYIWHDKSGAIVCNEVVYPTRESIEPDLKMLDDGQLVINFPLRSIYTCHMCNIQFASEKYYQEHVSVHLKNPHLWLIPTMLHCSHCHIKNCPSQRLSVINFIPKLIETIRDIPVYKCESNPCLLIWRMCLAKDFCEVMERILIKLVDEHRRLAIEQQFLDQTGHPDCDANLPKILDDLFFLFSVPYKTHAGDEDMIAKWPAMELARGDVELHVKMD